MPDESYDTPKQRTCLNCGVPLPERTGPGPRPKCCSRECYWASFPKKHVRNCAVCGKEFRFAMPSKAPKTCSRSCASTLRERNLSDEVRAQREAKRDERRKANWRTCAHPDCANIVNSSLARYCSRGCHYSDPNRRTAGRRVPWLIFRCETCGVSFERAPGHGTGRWCSPKCNPGPTKNNGRATPKPVAVVPPPPPAPPRWAWNEDEMICVVCGRGGAHRHHIIYSQHVVAVSPALAWDTRNRLGLCGFHHRSHHGRSATIPLALLPDSAYEFAAELLGAGAAYEYLARRYRGDDSRLVALLSEYPPQV